MRSVRLALVVLLLFTVVGCEGKLDKERFHRRAERSYVEVNAGWTIIKRRPDETVFVRGDQVDRLDVQGMFEAYEASKKKPSAYFDEWMEARKQEAEARKRTLEQAAAEVIPIIKSGKWIRVQDLGAIASARVRDQIRPWRKEIGTDVYAVLGIPEEKLGYRFASIDEVNSSKTSDDDWLKTSLENLEKMVGTATGTEMRNDEGRLRVLDMKNVDGISALVLDPRFRRRMLEEFQLPELGAAVPIRNVLIVFDPADFITIKPIRARTHQLYDTQNHPGFRGLLRFDKNVITILEGEQPTKKK